MTKTETIEDIRNEDMSERMFEAATDFWEWAPSYVITEDEENEIVRPYPEAKDFPYLFDLTEDIERNTLVCVLKSRRLLVTWTVTLRFFWKAQWSGSGIPGTSDAYRAAILSVDEEAVKDNIRHLMGVYERFPDWLKELNPLKVKNKMELEFRLGGAIKGFSLKQAGPRTYGFSEMLFDEMAFQMFARTTWTGAKPTLGKSGKMIAVSTPNGKGNFFHRLYKDPYKEFRGIHRIELPWYINPEHNEEWLESMCIGLDEQSIAREYKLSFVSGGGRAVFSKDFNEKAHILERPPEYIPNRPVLVGWDMGYHFPACFMGQMNGQDQLIGFFSSTGSDESIHDFGKKMLENRAAMFPKNTKFVHFVPVDAFKRYSGGLSKGGHISDYESLFNPRGGTFAGEQAYRGKIETAARLNSVRKMLKIREDGRAGCLFHRGGCADLIDGFLGGYCYAEDDVIARNPERAEEPLKSSYCVPLDTEMLTCDGWKEYEDVVVGSDAPLYDMQFQKVKIGKILDANMFCGRNSLIRLKNKEIDAAFTPNHRHIVETRYGVTRFVETKDLKQGHGLIPPPAIEVGTKYRRFSRRFIVVAAWVAAEGCYDKTDFSIELVQSRTASAKYVDYLSSLLDNDDCVIAGRSWRSRPNMVNWTITKEFAYMLRKMMPDKVPSAEFIMMMSNTERRLFLYEFMRGDGHAFNGTGDGRYMPDKETISRNKDFFVCPWTHRIFQKSKERIDALQMMAVLAGLNTSIRPKDGKGYTISFMRSRSRSDMMCLDRIDEVHSAVWCPQTTTGTWICRANGRVFVTGNSHEHDALQAVTTGYDYIKDIQKAKPQEMQEKYIGYGIGT